MEAAEEPLLQTADHAAEFPGAPCAMACMARPVNVEKPAVILTFAHDVMQDIAQGCPGTLCCQW